MPAEHAQLGRLRDVERWIAWVRVGAVPFAIFQVSISQGYPPGYRTAAWAITGVLAAGALVILVLAHGPLSPRATRVLGASVLVFDTAVLSVFVVTFNFQPGTPIRQLLFLAIVEGALRYALVGVMLVAAASVPVLVEYEHLRHARSTPSGFHVEYVTFQVGAELILGAIVGWLVRRLDKEARNAQARAQEAEKLRDELGRRVDTLEAVNRCARALGSSLELESAFGAFIRELRAVVPFDRVAIVLAEGELNRTIAVAGIGEQQVFAANTTRPLAGSLTMEVMLGQTTSRDDMRADPHADEQELLGLGLRSRVAAPLLVGARPIGMISISRTEPQGFGPEEAELVTLLGRLAGTAVQNIRAYESERHTADELRRLSALRADFVSLVSHELRSPMAAVIGSARTLQQRWRQLSPDQRDAFLALIADETDRLTRLIGDVLDTSRIEAGTFSYTFTNVALGDLVAEAVATADLAQDEVPVRLSASGSLPRVRGDRERLRQVVTNLIDNAVKYSPAGEPVDVAAHVLNDTVRLVVRDRGPGIAPEQQQLIFEKFGRGHVSGATAKPGTGLGLFIARSIAEAHGGSLEVDSLPGEGAAFTLVLPAG